jgi:MYXO-CTERM domain-containing protein
MNAWAFVLAALVFALPREALAGRFLFVSDTNTDNNIPTVLRGDGHTVDVVINDYNATTMNNARLQMPIGAYDAVFWSATGGGSGSVHAASTITNLTTYVTAGGRVFVTGYDSIASPPDPPLIGFLGGTGSIDVPGNPGAVINVANALTTGVVDIRGVTPTGGSSDRDSLTGAMAGTVIVVPTAGSTTEGQWILRTLGTGLIAYVSNGDGGGSTAHPSWTTTTPLAAGAYNAALRNFVAAAAGRGPPTMTLLPNGSACMAGSECMSTFCVDGVCCNNACAGGTTDCQACAMAAGAPANGTCAPVAAGRSCRVSTGVCDPAETCNGTATTCPADGLAAAGTVCRPAVTGGCDVAESCTGMAAACPEDRTAMDGTACNDTMTCNGAETCRGGMCAAGTAPDCDDRDPCTADMCVEPMGCGHAPIPGCGVVDAGADVPDSAIVPDVVVADVEQPDVVTPDVTVEDVATPDVPPVDASQPDAIVADAAMPDVEVKDVVRPDVVVTDTGASDAGATDVASTDVDTTDADTADGGFTDQPVGSSSGCGCAVPGRSDRSPASLVALVGLAAFLGARRRRTSR